MPASLYLEKASERGKPHTLLTGGNVTFDGKEKRVSQKSLVDSNYGNYGLEFNEEVGGVASHYPSLMSADQRKKSQLNSESNNESRREHDACWEAVHLFRGRLCPYFT